MSDEFQDLPAEEQAARLSGLALQALARWGTQGCDPRLIKFRENAVFEVIDRTGQRAALRVHRQNYHSDAALSAELEWMAMLADGGITVPRPVPSVDGAVLVKESSDEVPGYWQIDMLSWLDGVELGEIGEPLELDGRDLQALFRNFGRTVAQLHNLSEAWPRQMSVTRHAWDREGLVGEEPIWGHFWELEALTSGQRSLLLDARAAIGEDLTAYGQTSANYGLIHADLVPENVMLDGDAVQFIDFDDAGFGWHMFELVTALYWLGDEPEIEAMQRALFDGYRELRALTERDLATYPLFAAARSLTYVGWVHTRKNTETAAELTPLMIELAEAHCGEYLASR